jgi:hypothetical protein
MQPSVYPTRAPGARSRAPDVPPGAGARPDRREAIDAQPAHNRFPGRADPGEWTLFVEVERMTTTASLARKLVVNDEPSITDAVL